MDMQAIYYLEKAFQLRNSNIWNHTDQSTGNDKNFSAHITRAVTRLKSISITLRKPDGVAYKQADDFTIQLEPMVR